MAAEVLKIPGVGLARDLAERVLELAQRGQKGIARRLRFQVRELFLDLVESLARLDSKRFALGAGRLLIEKFAEELLQFARLSRRELHLEFEHDIAEGVRVLKPAQQGVAFQGAAVGTRFDLATPKQAGRCAKDGGVGPTIGLALEPLGDGLHRRPHTIARVRLGEVEDLLLRLGEIGTVLTEHAVVAVREEPADLVFGIGDAAQHAEIDVNLVDEGLERPLDPGLSILRANLDFLAPDEEPGIGHQVRALSVRSRCRLLFCSPFSRTMRSMLGCWVTERA